MMKKKMQAISFLGDRQSEIREVDVPEAEEGQVRVRLKGCGVCASNLPVWEGRSWFRYPYQAGAPGHEAWGVVDACGKNVRGFEPGQAVAILSYNGYAQYDVAPVSQVIGLPEALGDRPFPAEPLGCAVNVLKRCRPQPGEAAAVVGAGFLGTLVTALLAQRGHAVIVLSRRRFALQKAVECGAAYTLNIDDPDAIKEVRELTGGRGCSLVIEAVGGQKALDIATELTGERGRLALAGYHQDGLRQVNMQAWNWKGLDVINAHERQTDVYMQGIREAIELTEQGAIPLKTLLTHRYRLDDLSQAMTDLQERPEGFLKGCVIYE
jgi:threonine dehydrogenase-like Zn-dependent dehydrogenase